MTAFAPTFADSACLVTGGQGFIGSNLARRLVALGARVTVVDALVPGTGANLYNLAGVEQAVTLVRGDLRDERLMREVVAGQRFVFNLAGKVSHLDSIEKPRDDMTANLSAHLGLLEACRAANPHAKIVYSSTRQVFGSPRSLPVDETHATVPTDINGVHKLAAEGLHRVYHRLHGLPTVTLRLTNVYGPRMPVNNDRHGVIGWFVRQAFHAREISLFGEGTQLRDVCFVDDAVDALLLAMSTPAAAGHTFNVGGSNVVSLRGLVEAIIAAAGAGTYRLVPWPEERRRIDIGGFVTDDRRFREATGWRPSVPLQNGLTRTIAFYRAHGQRYWEVAS